MSTSLVGPLNTAIVRDCLDRIRTDLRRLEGEASGHCLTGNAGELRDLAKRLENLCSPTKGHLTGGAVARELRDAA